METIVIEGIGDIVSKPAGYGRALRKLKIDKGDELRVIFTDICDEWSKSTDSRLLLEREETRKELISWGAEFIDKSPSNPAQFLQYQDLLNRSVDAVFIATPDRFHIPVAKHWLTGNCKRVFIEKPLTNDPAEAKRWMFELSNNRHNRERLIQLDHYLPKIHAQFKYKEHIKQMLERIARLKHLRFYMLEDHSSTDQDYQKEVVRKRRRDRNGPIENEGRVDALQDGLGLDLLPHLLAILIFFGHPGTFKVTKLRAAKYVGVDFDYTPAGIAGIKGETFAGIEFSFINHAGREITGEAYVGKGIRGSINYPSMGRNVKVLQLEGEWQKKIEFDFNNSIVSSIVNTQSEPIVDLEPDPYYYLLRNVVFKRQFLGADLGLPITTGALILDKIAAEVTSRTTTNIMLPTYKLGGQNNEQPPLLEDLLQGGKYEIPPIAIP